MKRMSLSLYVLFLTAAYSCSAYDFPRFYRAAYFFGEPRFERPGLSSIDITLAGGTTDEARNSSGCSVPLLDIYGTTNMQHIADGVPCKDPQNLVDAALINLSYVAPTNCFANLSYCGRFTLLEANVSITQNISRGFYLQCIAPIKYFKLSDICCRDCSPMCCQDCSSTTTNCPNTQNSYWQTILHLFPQILNRYGLTLQGYSTTCVPEIFLLGGWTLNFEDTRILDYVDASIRIGACIPTGNYTKCNQLFDIDPGYGGHFGIPMLFDTSIGIFDWFTVGAHIDYLAFLNKTKEKRVKSGINQYGFLRLATACVNEQLGNIFDIGGYMKADHFAMGLSLYVGYTYSKQYQTVLKQEKHCTFDDCIMNSDPRLAGWDMQTVHFGAEFDCVSIQRIVNPRITLFYNWQIYGKNTFKTNMAGGTIGFEIALDH